jgi:hypothetical protein
VHGLSMTKINHSVTLWRARVFDELHLKDTTQHAKPMNTIVLTVVHPVTLWSAQVLEKLLKDTQIKQQLTEKKPTIKQHA